MNYPKHDELPPLPLTEEQLEHLRRMKAKQDELIHDYQAAIERALVGNLETLLGRVPGRKEIAKHGKAELDAEGNMVFSWKGKTFMTAAPLAPLVVERPVTNGF